MKRLTIIYNILIASLFLASGLVGGGSGATAAVGLMFVPVVIYFIRQLLSRTPTAVFGYASYAPASPRDDEQRQKQSDLKMSVAVRDVTPTSAKAPFGGGGLLSMFSGASTDTAIDGEVMDDAQVRDINRRLFLKLIGSAGLATFVLTLFTKEAQGAFFGSMPVPGLVGIKDSTGTTIDPAKNHPTDGYEVNDADDSGSPAYYGFVDKDNNWYITKESSDGSFRYVRGSGSYVANWTARASLSYGYFSNVF